MSAITPLNLVSPFVIELNAPAANLTAVLSPSYLATGNFYFYKRTDTSSKTVTVEPSANSGDTIDGQPSITLEGGQCVLLYCAGNGRYLILSRS